MMVTKDIISKAHAAFRNVNPDVWTDLSIYIGQVEYEAVALKAQLASKEKELEHSKDENIALERFAAKATARQVELELERTEYKHKLEYTEKYLNAAYAVIKDLGDHIAGKTISIGDANRAELVRVLKEQGYIKEIE